MESPVALESRVLASGDGWTVSDVVCSAGPHDRPFEEQHARTSIAIVVSGTFQYRTAAGHEMMTPGSVLLGNAGDCFTCGHEHGTGDRCLSFSFAPEFCERFAAGAGTDGSRFHAPRIAPLRTMATLVVRASELLAGAGRADFEELGIQALNQAAELAPGYGRRSTQVDAASLARVTRVVRMIDNDPESPQDLGALAGSARLSPYHFLRTFEAATGTTPHQYLLRMRLRRAAIRLRTEPGRILNIALDCGFGDVSNFNRTFRAEFGVSPRAWRSQSRLPR